jgi:hypothetical protein
LADLARQLKLTAVDMEQPVLISFCAKPASAECRAGNLRTKKADIRGSANIGLFGRTVWINLCFLQSRASPANNFLRPGF